MSGLGPRSVHIVGVAETALGEVRDHTELSMVALAAREALAEAGCRPADVDSVLVNYMGEQGSVKVAEYLGIRAQYGDSSDLGGSAFEAFVHHAMWAIAAGQTEVALIAFASRQRSRRLRQLAPAPSSGTAAFAADRTSLTDQFQTPYGLPYPIGNFALAAARHMAQYGTTAEQLAQVAVTARQWAALNPKAWAREPLTIDDVLSSRLISDPLHKLDCCLVTDGGGAIVLTHQDRARDAAKKPVRVLGAAECQTHWHVAQVPDLTVTPGVISGHKAFAMAGIRPADVDVFAPYDAFTVNVIMQLEDLGFCAKGEGGAFVQGGHIGPGGTLPSMTAGGGLSYCHPGALGILLLIEAVRQLRGESGDRQVRDPEVAVAHGIGGVGVAATVVLGRA